MYKIIALTLSLGVFMLMASCGGGATNSNSGETPVDPNDNPIEAYKRLFTAVKAKDANAIKNSVSVKTQGLAETLAARQKKSVEEIYANGFTATTFSDSLPEIRDQRVKDDMGAIEVWNSKDKTWEDLPFIREPSGWRLAVGDLFANTFRSPGRGRDSIEREAANVMNGNKMKVVNVPMNAPVNTNVNSASNTSKPPANR